jgi:hypothetical protein
VEPDLFCRIKTRASVWDVVLMPVVPVTWEAEIRRIDVQAQSRQRELLRKTPSQPTSQILSYVPIIPTTQEV